MGLVDILVQSYLTAFHYTATLDDLVRSFHFCGLKPLAEAVNIEEKLSSNHMERRGKQRNESGDVYTGGDRMDCESQPSTSLDGYHLEPIKLLDCSTMSVSCQLAILCCASPKPYAIGLEPQSRGVQDSKVKPCEKM